MSEKVVLNGEDAAVGTEASSSNADEITRRMRISITQLKGKFMREDGKMVNYAAIGTSKEFTSYIQAARELKLIDLSQLSQEELKCLFVNVYNSLTVHALVHQYTKGGLPKAPKDVEGFWSIHCYVVGGLTYSLDDMEHGVLRSNKGHPSGSSAQFNADDARVKFIVKQLDPRIHFALNCGALSCPPIRVYTTDRLDEQLQTASIAFLSQEVELVRKGDKDIIEMSRLLLWYSQDFGKDDNQVVNWILSVVGDKVTGLKETAPNFPEIVYKEYDWDTNNLN